jgi:hypothetical protein
VWHYKVHGVYDNNRTSKKVNEWRSNDEAVSGDTQLLLDE